MCVALVGTIESVSGNGVERLALVRIGDQLREINMAFVPEAAVGDRVVVHSGIAVRVQRSGEPAPADS